jgi:hypothetical protein
MCVCAYECTYHFIRTPSMHTHSYHHSLAVKPHDESADLCVCVCIYVGKCACACVCECEMKVIYTLTHTRTLNRQSSSSRMSFNSHSTVECRESLCR